MSSHRNYLDADNSIMERNLRFVRNDLEDNLNQYFGGSGSRNSNSTTVTAPPRDYNVVQPKPGGSHALTTSSGLEKRREFLLQLGLARHEAYELAKNSNFDVNDYQVKCQKWINSGVQLIDVNNRILSEIREGNDWNEPVTHGERSYFEKPDHLQHDGDGRGYNEIYDRRSQRYRSRSRSPTRRNVQREDHYQPLHSHSPNRNFNPMYGKKNEQRFFCGDESIRRQEIRNESPHRSNRREEYERGNEEYFMQQDNFRIRHRSRSYSPLTNDHRIEEYNSSRSRSSKNFDESNFNEYSTRDRMREQSFSPLGRRDSREKRYLSPRSHRSLDLIQENEITFQNRNDFRNEERRDNNREHSRSFSPSLHDRKKEHFQSSRSRSPIRGFNERNPEYFSQHGDYRKSVQSSRSRSPNKDFNERNPENFSKHGDYRKSVHRRSRSRSYSPSRNERNEEFYYSSNSRSPNRRMNLTSQDIYYRGEGRRDTKNFDNSRETKAMNQPNREIPSLLTLDVFGNQTQRSQDCLQNQRNIPSLLSLKVLPDLTNYPQPSTSAKANRFNQESNRKELTQHGYNKPTKFDSNFCDQSMERGPNTNNKKSGLRPHFAEVPIIHSGLKKPLAGKLKFNPQDYWSQWWPTYKYIEYSIPKINPNDKEIKECINFLFKPQHNKFRHSKNLLLNKGVNTIMKTVDINETNYYVRDIYKLFKYKKHLEDPNFQNHLNPQELNCIAPALRQFQIKSTMALLYQALICRWHISLDIIKKVQAGEPILSNYARTLLNDKCFHYLVKEAIQELKKMCQQDWPQFDDFYKNIKAKKVNIYSMGVGPDNAKPNVKYNDEDDHDNIY